MNQTPLPLNQRRILITRAGRSAEKMAEHVQALGGEALVAPVLSFHRRTISSSDFEKAIQSDWLIFTSGTGVLFFLELLKEFYGEARPKLPPIAVVGRKTANVLETHQLEVDLIPSSFTAKDLAALFKNIDGPQRVTLIQGQLARDTLETELIQQGHHTQALTVYETRPDFHSQEALKKWVSESKIDVATFASPSSIDFFLDLTELRVSDVFFERIHIACIGPETRAHALDRGLNVSIMPKTYTALALIQEIANFYLEGSTCTN